MFLRRLQGTQRRYRAFISYSHEDRQTVDWLFGVLKRTWVPWTGRRRVFLDRKTLRSGPLDASIAAALLESEYLILCASSAAEESSWVGEELRQFASSGRTDRMLVAAVGGREGPIWVPPMMPGGLLIPDLRGNPDSWSAEQKREKRAEALALLATILELPDKEALSRRRLKFALLSAALLTLLSACWLGWQWDHQRWLRTPQGAIDSAVGALVQSTSDESVDEVEVLWGCRALGRLGREDALETVAKTFRSEPFQRLGRSAGLSAFDSKAAVDELQLLDSNEASYFPEAYLLVADSAKIAPHEGAKAACQPMRWVRALLATGRGAEASEALLGLGVALEERFPLVLRASLSGGPPLESLGDDVREWWLESDADAIELRWLLENLDLDGLLASDALRPLLEFVDEAVAQMAPEHDYQWMLLQGYCARVAVLGPDPNGSLRVEQTLESGTASLDEPDAKFMSSAWAYRGLAFERLGRGEKADAAFDQARFCLEQPESSSGMGAEHRDVALALCLAGRWAEGIELASSVPNTRMRSIALSEALKLFVGPEVYPWSSATR